MSKKLRKLLACFTVSGFIATAAGAQQPAFADVFYNHWIGGRILEAFIRNGGHESLGNAITPENNAARGGKFQVFERDASIYWHPAVSGGVAHLTGGAIREKWSQLGWENGTLKYPITDELTTTDGLGKFNHFEGGSIFWLPTVGAHQVGGDIQDRWIKLGQYRGLLGYPTTDETAINNGRYNHFQRGSIYWSPETGAHSVRGRIRDFWARSGWELSSFGYPTSEERSVRVGALQSFKHGDIQWVPTNNSTLPVAQDGYGSYNHQYLVFGEESERWSPESLNREILQNFDSYFTFTGCGHEIYVGKKCDLNAVFDLKAPVEIVAATATGFAIRSLDGHPEGADRTITFNFYRWNVSGTAKNEIRMDVRAWGPVSAGSLLGPLNSESLARVSWSRFVRNIVERVNDSRTTYVTADKNIGGAPLAAGPTNRQAYPLEGVADGEFINPWLVDVSGIGTEIPLVSRDKLSAPATPNIIQDPN